MDTLTNNLTGTDPDTQAIISHIMTGTPLDPDIYRRVRAESERATEEMRQHVGTVEIAVDLIRETRDDS